MVAIAAEGDRLPFEVHRVVEYLLGLGLISLFVNDAGRRPVVALAGFVVLALAATTRGRLGMLRWLPLGLHRALDVVVVVAMAGVPFVPGAGGALAALYLAPSAAALALLTRHTSYRATTATVTTPDRPPIPGAAVPGGIVATDGPRRDPAGGDTTGPHASGSLPPSGGQGAQAAARALGAPRRPARGRRPPPG